MSSLLKHFVGSMNGIEFYQQTISIVIENHRDIVHKCLCPEFLTLVTVDAVPQYFAELSHCF